MLLSRARPALRNVARQQRMLSAAPQPVYEPHVACTSVESACAPRRHWPDISKPPATPPPRRPNSSTPPPRRQNSSAAHPSSKTQVPQQKIDENGGLMEYSVVYTDRAMNHMSAPFQEVMHCVEIKFWIP